MKKVSAPPLHKRLPAEFDPQRAVWMGWPHNPNDWPGKFAAVKWAFVEMIRLLSRSQTVRLLVVSDGRRAEARRMLTDSGADMSHVEFVPMDLDRNWTRDILPFFVRSSLPPTPPTPSACPGVPDQSDQSDQPAGPAGPVGPVGSVQPGGACTPPTPAPLTAVRFAFNGWGKYPNHRKDLAAAPLVAGHLGLSMEEPAVAGRHVVLEGGAVDGNGRGDLLATEECLLDQTTQVRNPGLGRADYEAVFAAHLGVKNAIWLGRGVAGDDTHGHVDDFCRFVGPDTVVLCREGDPCDVNHRVLAENRERLAGARLACGAHLTVIDLPMPAPLAYKGVRLPASYANFYIGNHVVLVPTFNDPRDRKALSIVADCFPGRAVHGVHAVELAWGFGAVHCLTHEEPTGEE
ncbi:agmatine deiminase family protein [Desulfolutivibrio sp.]|uniref:agmatine deiminase family protein n=1 Tax=Desulfolutivibrio sp. TaxID=2773296 RepID=UPI002F96D5EB